VPHEAKAIVSSNAKARFLFMGQIINTQSIFFNNML